MNVTDLRVLAFISLKHKTQIIMIRLECVKTN